HWYRADSRGAPRKGAALLQGIVCCSRCGRKRGLQHYATRDKRAPAYTCSQAYHNEGGAACQCMSAKGVEEAVTALFLRAVTPAKVDLAVRAWHAVGRDRTAAREQGDCSSNQRSMTGKERSAGMRRSIPRTGSSPVHSKPHGKRP